MPRTRPWEGLEDADIIGDGDEALQRRLQRYEKGILAVFPIVITGLYALAIAALGQRL